MVMKAFGDVNGGPCRVVVVIGGGNGNSRLQLGDGSIISVQPDGSVQTRPAESDGPYEWCRVSGAVATYMPTPSVAYVFALADTPVL